MKIKHYPEEKLKKEILEILARHLDLSLYRIFFFGSRVSGGGTDRSDIDIGIEGEAPLSAKAWSEIQEEIENLPTLYKIELVDFKEVSDDFREVALQFIDPIAL